MIVELWCGIPENCRPHWKGYQELLIDIAMACKKTLTSYLFRCDEPAEFMRLPSRSHQSPAQSYTTMARPPPPCPIARPTPHHSMTRSAFRKGGSGILPCYKKKSHWGSDVYIVHGRAGIRVLSFYIENGAQISNIICIAGCRVLICLRIVSYERSKSVRHYVRRVGSPPRR